MQFEDCPSQPDSLSHGDSDIYKVRVECSYILGDAHCPVGYYCPNFNAAQLNQSDALYNLQLSNCTYGSVAEAVTGSSDYLAVCPCTPGFFCPENSAQPAYCTPGYYCPGNSKIDKTAFGSPIGDDGLGQWGTLSYNCPDNHWCGYNQVEPFKCGLGSLHSCHENSEKESSAGAIILLALAIFFMYIVFIILGYREVRKKREESLRNIPELSYKDQGNVELSVSKKAANDDAYLIEFQNISLTLKTGTVIMKGVSGSFKPGRMCAIMGPSGAGKTTIISLVTGKAKRTDGKVLLNGVEVEGLMDIRKIVGFVPQEDVMIRELTVRDIIDFSARYRLPASFSEEEIHNKVSSCIEELGISHVQFSIIGDEATRGISGGQRKRVNIGIEMVTDPKILFLDEPTSGLDSTTTVALCQTLKNIARSRNMTIASVIHQPSIYSFLEFDDLLLLGKGGQVIYHGPLLDAPDYFTGLGFVMPEKCNPADFYLDVASGMVPREGHPEFEWPQLFELWRVHCREGDVSLNEISLELEQEENSNLKELNKYAAQKEISSETFYRSIVNFLTDARDAFIYYFWFGVEYMETTYKFLFSNFTCKKDPIRETPSMFTQFVICSWRALKQNFRGFRPWILEMAVHLMIGIVVASSGEAYFAAPLPRAVCIQQSLTLQSICTAPPVAITTFQNKANFAAFGITFASISMGAGTFLYERTNYWREVASGMNTFPYFLAKFIVNIPRIVCSAFFFWTAFTSNYINAGSNAHLYAIFLMMYWFGFALGYVTSQLVPPGFVAIFGVMISLIFCIAFSGVNPTMKEVYGYPQSRQNLWQISGPRWTIEAFVVDAVKYYYELPQGSGYSGEPYLDLNDYIENYGYKIHSFASDIRACLGCGFGWAFIALFLMVITNLDKKQ